MLMEVVHPGTVSCSTAAWYIANLRRTAVAVGGPGCLKNKRTLVEDEKRVMIFILD